MATYSVTNGVASYSNTLTANTADTVTFADRYSYVTVTNTGTGVLYARADGTTAVAAAQGTYAVLPAESAILANGQALWYPSSKVLQAGTANQLQESRTGGAANPGTVISLVSVAADGYTIAAAA